MDVDDLDFEDDPADEDYSPYTEDMDEVEDDDDEEDKWDSHEDFSFNEHPVQMRKFIVFESCLRALLAVCMLCLAPCTTVIKHIRGTLVVMKSTCQSGHVKIWYSQPMSGSMPLGNLMCASSVLFSGCSSVKAINMLKNVNIESFSKATYNRIQRVYLLLGMALQWDVRRYQTPLPLLLPPYILSFRIGMHNGPFLRTNLD
ncbi:uncharacterized protein LOC143026613 isoform X1 [Oratosquilla oratoria]|uniref:uncharacterized protein LOC143026613 isoform X1 n=1 Tax=Oratosquilla oratoria TaxID=337810 RepID=UPI003F76ABCF